MLFDYLYVGNPCWIMVGFVEHTPKFHEYNVCIGNTVRLSEIVDIIGTECGRGFLLVCLRMETLYLPACPLA